MQQSYNNVFLIERKGKLGLDTAHKEAYSYAIKNNYDLFISMDADFSHDPNQINSFIENLESFPFVIGSRYIKGGKCLMKGKRLLLSKYGNLIIKFILQIDCNEFTTSYRGFNLKKLSNFHLNLIIHHSILNDSLTHLMLLLNLSHQTHTLLDHSFFL